jgi:5-(carboxyamino)imidazole ribonucleotide synthase
MKIGILGAGQLARMMAIAGVPMGFEFSFYDNASECCAAPLGQLFQGDFDNQDKLKAFADSVDVITYEFENVPLETIDLLPKDKPVYPPKAALENTQDRLTEKNLFKELGIPTPGYMPINNEDDLKKAADTLKLPFVLKTRGGGYDGKGQMVLQSQDDFPQALNLCTDTPCIAEAWVNYDREISVIGVFAEHEYAVYELNENEHRNGVLHLTQNRKNDPVQTLAAQWIEKLAHQLNYRGVLTIEFFQCGDTLLANEYAPRVHNSGHWTIEGSITSQFENHIRAIAGLPLGAIESTGVAKMYNCLGAVPKAKDLLHIKGLHLHNYGKSPRQGRKVGHINLVHNSNEASTFAEQSLLDILQSKQA